MRRIEEILYFRSDISPFLVHLTRNSEIGTADENLDSILGNKFLMPGGDLISDARFGVSLGTMSRVDQLRFFSAISFSETPLSEIHCLLEISRREVNLEPWGVVFLKDRLKRRGVSPVIYVNNEQADKDDLVRALVGLRRTAPDAAAQILPLVSVVGSRLRPMGGAYHPGRVDFSWEREWRYAEDNGLFEFTEDDIFLGLCPHNQIDMLERKYRPILFIDPRRNVRWYARKLVNARKRLDLKYSVV